MLFRFKLDKSIGHGSKANTFDHADGEERSHTSSSASPQYPEPPPENTTKTPVSVPWGTTAEEIPIESTGDEEDEEDQDVQLTKSRSLDSWMFVHESGQKEAIRKRRSHGHFFSGAADAVSSSSSASNTGGPDKPKDHDEDSGDDSGGARRQSTGRSVVRQRRRDGLTVTQYFAGKDGSLVAKKTITPQHQISPPRTSQSLSSSKSALTKARQSVDNTQQPSVSPSHLGPNKRPRLSSLESNQQSRLQNFPAPPHTSHSSHWVNPAPSVVSPLSAPPAMYSQKYSAETWETLTWDTDLSQPQTQPGYPHYHYPTYAHEQSRQIMFSASRQSPQMAGSAPSPGHRPVPMQLATPSLSPAQSSMTGSPSQPALVPSPGALLVPSHPTVPVYGHEAASLHHTGYPQISPMLQSVPVPAMVSPDFYPVPADHDRSLVSPTRLMLDSLSLSSPRQEPQPVHPVPLRQQQHFGFKSAADIDISPRIRSTIRSPSGRQRSIPPRPRSAPIVVETQGREEVKSAGNRKSESSPSSSSLGGGGDSQGRMSIDFILN